MRGLGVECMPEIDPPKVLQLWLQSLFSSPIHSLSICGSKVGAQLLPTPMPGPLVTPCPSPLYPLVLFEPREMLPPQLFLRPRSVSHLLPPYLSN